MGRSTVEMAKAWLGQVSFALKVKLTLSYYFIVCLLEHYTRVLQWKKHPLVCLQVTRAKTQLGHVLVVFQIPVHAGLAVHHTFLKTLLIC